jgi:hypothetical protein
MSHDPWKKLRVPGGGYPKNPPMCPFTHHRYITGLTMIGEAKFRTSKDGIGMKGRQARMLARFMGWKFAREHALDWDNTKDRKRARTELRKHLFAILVRGLTPALTDTLRDIFFTEQELTMFKWNISVLGRKAITEESESE